MKFVVAGIFIGLFAVYATVSIKVLWLYKTIKDILLCVHLQPTDSIKFSVLRGTTKIYEKNYTY